MHPQSITPQSLAAIPSIDASLREHFPRISPSERLQLLNLWPANALDVYLIVEDAEAKVGDDDRISQLLAFFHLPK